MASARNSHVDFSYRTGTERGGMLEPNMKVIDSINHLLSNSLKLTLKSEIKLNISTSCFLIHAYDKSHL